MSVIDNKWEFSFNNVRESLEKRSEREFEWTINYIYEHIIKLLDGFKHQSLNYSGNVGKRYDDDLKLLVEKNKQLRNEIDTKLEELRHQQAQYTNFKRDGKLLSQEIKDTHEAFLMAKKYYKKYLKMYYTIEIKDDLKQIIFIQFFTETKRDNEIYSVRLWRDSKAKYELLETIPKLDIFGELQRRLQLVNDVPGILCCIRRAFIAIRTKN